MIQPLKINKKIDNDAKIASIIRENIPATEYMSADEVNSMVAKINEMVPAINVSNGGFQGTLTINEKRVDSGFYIPTESGTFINADNVKVDLSQGVNFVTYDGDKWDVAVVPIIADGKVEEGNAGFVSGGEVFSDLKKINYKSEEEEILSYIDFSFHKDMYLSSTNTLIVGKDFGVTDYIEVKPNTLYKWFGRLLYNRVCIEYDENKNPIDIVVNKEQSTQVILSKEFETSSTAKYVRLCSQLIDNNQNMITCGFYKLPVYNQIYPVTKNIGDYEEVIFSSSVYNELLNIKAFETDKIISKKVDFIFHKDMYLSSTNTLIVGKDFGVTDYIEVKPNTLYKWFGRLSYNRVCIEYDKYKKPIDIIVNKEQSTQAILSKEFETSNNAKYVRLCSLLVNAQQEIDCGLSADKQYNYIEESVNRVANIDNPVRSSAVFRELTKTNRVNFTVPFLDTIWIPEVLSDSNNYSNTNYLDYINSFDFNITELIENNLEIIKEDLGKDQSKQFTLYSYHLRSKTSLQFPSKPKILLFSGQHGSEFSNPFALKDFVKLLVSDNSSLFKYLRRSFEWVILPIVNPWGFQNRKRSNLRGVNLNRNFSEGWKKQDSPSDFGNYSGENPFSESESKIVRDLIIKHNDFIIALDGHSYSGFEDNINCMFWIDSYNIGLKNVIIPTSIEITEYTKKLIPKTASSTDVFSLIYENDFSQANTNGTLQAYLYSVNNKAVSATFEIAMRIYLDELGTGSKEIRTINLSSYVSVLLNIIRNYSF